jgi:hypothetical protein
VFLFHIVNPAADQPPLAPKNSCDGKEGKLHQAESVET